MARPSTAPVRKQVNLPAELAEKIDAYRFSARFGSESEAIRSLIERGLSSIESIPEERPKPTRKAKVVK